MTYPQDNARWTQWQTISEQCDLTGIQLYKDEKGTLFLAGLTATGELEVQSMPQGKPDFGDKLTLGNAPGAGLNKIIVHRTVQFGKAPLIWLVQGDDGKLFRNFGTLSAPNWVPLNFAVPTGINWGGVGISEQEFYLYGINDKGILTFAKTTFTPPAGQAPPTWTSVPNRFHNDEGWSDWPNPPDVSYPITEVTATLNIDGEIEFGIYAPRNGNDATYYKPSMGDGYWNLTWRYGHGAQLLLSPDGKIMDFRRADEGTLSYRYHWDYFDSHINRVGRPVGGNVAQWKVLTDSIGNPLIFARNADNTIGMIHGGGDNNGFTSWGQPFGGEITITDFDVAVNGYGRLQMIVIDSKGALLTISGMIDDSKIFHDAETKVAAKTKILTINQSAKQVNYHAVQPNLSSEPADDGKKHSIRELMPYRQPMVTSVKKVADHIKGEGYELLLGKDSFGKMIEAHVSMNDFKPGNVLQYVKPAHFTTLANKAKLQLLDQFKNPQERVDYQTRLITEMTTLAQCIDRLSTHIGLPLPVDVDHFVQHTLPMVKVLPDAAIKKIKSYLPDPDFSQFSAALDGMEAEKPDGVMSMAEDGTFASYSEKTVLILAGVSAVCKLISGLLKVVYKGLPLKVGLGVNFIITASGKARLVAEADISGGGAVGIGVSVPIVGIGIYAGAGAANGTLLKLDVIWIGLLPVFLAPIDALCMTAHDVIETVIKIDKGK